MMYDLKMENIIMQRHTEGDQVRIDIPDKTDPDFELYHGEQGEIVQVIEDDAGKATRDKRDGVLYRVRLDDGETIDLRWRDLRPSSSESN